MWASLVAQTVKNLPPMWQTWIRSLSWEDPMEEGMATHSNNLAWRIPWAEETIVHAAAATAKLLQSCPSLCDPMGRSPPASSVHGTLQARILEWAAMPSTRGSSQASYLCLLPWQADSLPLSYQGNYTLKFKRNVT